MEEVSAQKLISIAYTVLIGKRKAQIAFYFFTVEEVLSHFCNANWSVLREGPWDYGCEERVKHSMTTVILMSHTMRTAAILPRCDTFSLLVDMNSTVIINDSVSLSCYFSNKFLSL